MSVLEVVWAVFPSPQKEQKLTPHGERVWSVMDEQRFFSGSRDANVSPVDDGDLLIILRWWTHSGTPGSHLADVYHWL